MRQTCVFSGSSHPGLTDAICERLGRKPDLVELSKFKNGETRVEIKTSVRDKDVFIVQSGSSKINDSVMELLIMIAACKGGSARSTTAVLPYFPYSRQSKKKSHRGAITARMLANLLSVAGVDHVITIDLHASQMQGFFKCPVDNLIAEPILAKWIRTHIKDWQKAVVVSKNPGGTKRVTSLADALKLSFGIVTTDRRKTQVPASMMNSVVFDDTITRTQTQTDGTQTDDGLSRTKTEDEPAGPIYHGSSSSSSSVGGGDAPIEKDFATYHQSAKPSDYLNPSSHSEMFARRPASIRSTTTLSHATANRLVNGDSKPSSPLAQSTKPDDSGSGSEQLDADEISPPALTRARTAMATSNSHPTEEVEEAQDDKGADYSSDEGEPYTDERARNVVTGRLIHGHLVDDDHPSPALSGMVQTPYMKGHNRSDSDESSPPEHMLQSFMSIASSRHVDYGLGGTGDATASDDEDDEALHDPELETTITLVGKVKYRPVFIVDDIIDKPSSWIAAAETCVKKGGATHVYCIATHALFDDEALQEMEACAEIDGIIVTNSFPIPEDKRKLCKKLTVLDVAHLLSEAIRRNKHGESISQLFQHYVYD